VIQLRRRRFFVAVGDVSDKGIPAALLMARVMTLAKLLVPTSRDLGLLASVLNTQLEEGNAEMYVHDTVRRESSTRGTAEVRCVSPDTIHP
jgi:serine phosphatase RsbU (regulator of sigma subunit)